MSFEYKPEMQNYKGNLIIFNVNILMHSIIYFEMQGQ